MEESHEKLREILFGSGEDNDLRFKLLVAPCASCSKPGAWNWPEVTTRRCGETELSCCHGSSTQIPAVVTRATSAMDAIARWNTQNWGVRVVWNHTFDVGGVLYSIDHVCHASDDEVKAMLQDDLDDMSRVLEQREQRAEPQSLLLHELGESPQRYAEIEGHNREVGRAEPPQDTIPFTAEAVKEYLHQAVTRWRLIRAYALEEIPLEDEEEFAIMAPYYVDAFQSVHVSLFGTLIP